MRILSGMSNVRMLQYCLLLLLSFINGCFVSSLGPLIPHFSSVTGLDETHYSYLFFVRSAANVFGGFLVKYLVKHFNNQALLIFYQLIIATNLFMSTLSLSSLNIAITYFLIASSFLGIVVLIYDVTFKLFLKEEPEYWIQLHGFLFGVGAMCGPFFVALFQLQTFEVLAILQVISLCAFLKFPLPNFIQSFHHKSEEKVQQEQGIQLGERSAFFIAIIFFLFATQQLGLASWISTYSIRTGVADLNGSAFYCLLFWLLNCIGRLVWMYVPGNVERRLGEALIAVIFSLLATLIFQYFEWYHLVCIFTPITSGILMAGVFGLGISMPVDNGFLPSSQNNANFLLANAFGQGLLIMPMGYSLNLLGFKYLMIESCLFSFVSYWAYRQAVRSMRKDKEQHENKLLQDKI